MFKKLIKAPQQIDMLDFRKSDCVMYSTRDFMREELIVTTSTTTTLLPCPTDFAMAGPQYPNHPVTHVKPARPLYRFAATALGASMWFFLMYRAKKDGPALLGWKHPWDH
ncbi:hypothetical protein GJ744_004930 [Endocarpon pusillum]|uniref:NADH dehydrogenase [ubiquinone] 1 beta subcomplex subunit 2 n=1 Tax=Endocarpon pusillum TaxID=364733 RepID=A0A8H7ALH9_9EURO|nr:hypothetical protein GJ744_004930 [Endocarpon pusillum]